MGEGETPEVAIADGYSSAQAWLQVAQACDDPIPKPSMGGESGRFVTRVLKSLHTRLVARTKQDGIRRLVSAHHQLTDRYAALRF